jgi:hypothetical protein
MTCLKLSSSIHPTSAATGTEDDMGGNDKADALVEWDVARVVGGVQRNFFSNSGQFEPVLVFYDISPARMHLAELKKHRV